jgi:2-dehydropantoate 2-reductase
MQSMAQHWHILGAGAIGRLMACKLRRMGLDPTLVVRGNSATAVRQQLRREGAESEVLLSCRGSASFAPADIKALLVTTKANQAEAALAELLPALASSAPVVLLHNGMGVLERLSAAHPMIDFYAGTTTEGAYRDGDVLVHAGLGETVIGRQGEPEPAWFQAWSSSAERCRWDPDINQALWRKLLVNCAINPLTAVHRCRNGFLLDNPALRAELELLCEELAVISAARGNDKGASCALDWALSVIQATAPNQSSMLQDVELGRATEIEYISGYLVREARRLGVPCPRNERLLTQVRALDSAHVDN